MKALLERLGLEARNPGTWTADGGWLDDPAAPLIESVNPATGEHIASVAGTTPPQ